MFLVIDAVLMNLANRSDENGKKIILDEMKTAKRVYFKNLYLE